MPFIFARIKNDCQDKFDINWPRDIKDWVVMIAQPDFTSYECEWMDDPEMGKIAYIPDVDISKEDHIFPDFQSARQFVMKWWIAQYSLESPEIVKSLNTAAVNKSVS